ncbi:MAG TPA: hypothetical protein VK184_08805 [Nostocaceae cyanobacterium]|nr:hypothetical protein [Nostocaceae cyanobacterium]
MTISSSQFTNSKFHTLNTIPKPLDILFHKIKLEHYAELYESEADGNASLRDDLNQVLEVMSEGNHQLNHLRYLWMTLILTLAVEPTLEYYKPSHSLPKKIIKLIILLLRNIANNSIKSAYISHVFIDKLTKELFKNQESYFHVEGADFQEISEALDVFYNALKVINYDQSIEALLEILDDCLEGYAIFPGSSGRRELFDWWLLEVVPASWYLLPPKTFYVVEGLENQVEIKLRQTRLLEKVSAEIWYTVLREIIDKPIQKSNSLSNPCIPIYPWHNDRYTKINISVGINSIPDNTPVVCFA